MNHETIDRIRRFTIVMSKMEKNEAKYPIEKASGSAVRYDKL